jgi:cytochrome c oxidase subunit IV
MWSLLGIIVFKYGVYVNQEEIKKTSISHDIFLSLCVYVSLCIVERESYIVDYVHTRTYFTELELCYALSLSRERVSSWVSSHMTWLRWIFGEPIPIMENIPIKLSRL